MPAVFNARIGNSTPSDISQVGIDTDAVDGLAALAGSRNDAVGRNRADPAIAIADRLLMCMCFNVGAPLSLTSLPVR